jgi:homoserine dehydrogenase
MKPVFLNSLDQAVADAPPPRPRNIALAGFGIVGQALAARLAGDPRFRIGAVLVRDPNRRRAIEPPVPLTADRRAFLATSVDILVEVTSCDRTGALLAERALERGTSVVSASKRVVSASGTALARAAETGGARLLHSAAVGGGAPVLETISAAQARGPIRSVVGVLNGTVNYILARLGRGGSFADALAEARLAGFAEEDPSEDLSGRDAAAKLRLIAAAAFGGDPASVEVRVEALDGAAIERIGASGERWIQLGRLERTGETIEAEVRLVPQSLVDALPPLPDEWNGIAVTLADGTVFRCRGRGAGGAPTAESILSDLERLVEAERLPC